MKRIWVVEVKHKDRWVPLIDPYDGVVAFGSRFEARNEVRFLRETDIDDGFGHGRGFRVRFYERTIFTK